MKPKLLSIVEVGGYPDLTPRYEALGFKVFGAKTQRKALQCFKAERPEVIVAEFIFTPDFRDRISNLDTLATQIQAHRPDAHLILLYEPEDQASLERFRARIEPTACFPHPVEIEALLQAVAQAR